MMAEQLARGWSAYKTNHTRSYRWWLKRWQNRQRRRALRRSLADAPARFTKGYEW